VTLTLPHAPVQEVPAQRTPLAAPSPHRHALEVLLVEDNELNQQLASILVTRWGHRVTVAGNGVEALQAHAAGRFDLILMDLQMPLMGGMEATAAIRQRERDGATRTAIVALTATADEDRQQCIAGGMDEFLSKPIDPAKLEQLLRHYVAVALPAPAPAPPAPAPYDYAAGLDGAEPIAIESIGRAFLDTLPSHFEVMRTALAKGDGLTLKRQAHTLTGLLANFVALPALQLSAAIDRDGIGTDPAQAAARIDALELEVARFAPCLAARLTVAT
jgi:two-component system sensor histidine kinase/response regulator